jgi:methylglyoxal synthase
MAGDKCIALMAHDQKKGDMAEFARRNHDALARFRIIATGRWAAAFSTSVPTSDVTRMKSGPLGGDQQIGAMIAEGKVDIAGLPHRSAHPVPHDVDVKALTRLAVLYDIPMALNEVTAERLIKTLQP